MCTLLLVLDLLSSPLHSPLLPFPPLLYSLSQSNSRLTVLYPLHLLHPFRTHPSLRFSPRCALGSYHFVCGSTIDAEPLCWGGNDHSNRAIVAPALVTSGVDLAPAGFYRPGSDDLPCPVGWTSKPGMISVLGCNIDLGCPPGATGPSSQNCSLCSPGTYKTSYSTEACTPCAKGYYQEAAGSTNCTSLCPVGSYSNSMGLSSASQCKQCAAGTFTSTTGSLACTPCAKGSYEDAVGRYVYLIELIDVVFRLNAFSLSLSLLPIPSAQCKACPNRTFADSTGLASCKVCQPGKIFDVTQLVSPSANPCVSCVAGTFRNHNRSETDADNKCTKCGLGKWSKVTGADSNSTCTDCVAGKVGNQLGMSLLSILHSPVPEEIMWCSRAATNLTVENPIP